MARKTISEFSFRFPYGRDDTGALVEFEFICPYCKTDNCQMVFIDYDGTEVMMSGSFEVDIETTCCGKELTLKFS